MMAHSASVSSTLGLSGRFLLVTVHSPFFHYTYNRRTTHVVVTQKNGKCKNLFASLPGATTSSSD
jgi:hypothetical protein